jgi:hypothetical protein
LQAQGRRAFERKREIYITDFVALLKIIFSLDGNIIGCPLVPPQSGNHRPELLNRTVPFAHFLKEP